MSTTTATPVQEEHVCLRSPDDRLSVRTVVWNTGVTEHWISDGTDVVAIYRHQESPAAALALYREQVELARREFADLRHCEMCGAERPIEAFGVASYPDGGGGVAEVFVCREGCAE